MYFSHPECLPYSGTWTVYFIMGNHVYVIQALGLSSRLYRIKRILSTHFSHPECLHYSVTWTVYFVKQVWNIRILSIHFIHLECLHYSGTRTGYYIMRNYVYIILWHGLSTLFRHKDLRCLLYSFTLTVFFIMATNVCISMACVFTIPATVFLVMSSGVVYVVLALGVSTLVRPPSGNAVSCQLTLILF